MKINVLGVRFDDLSAEQVRDVLHAALERREGSVFRVVTPNPEIVMAARNPAMRAMINESGLVLKDGVGIKWAEAIRGVRGMPRITGIDTLHLLLGLAQEKKAPVYIVGASQDVLLAAKDKIRILYPELVFAGAHHGYFAEGSEEEEEVLADVAASGARLIVVAMGFPKQERFMARLRGGVGAVAIGCGGSLDVLSGRVKRAPVWMQRAGLEWMYRLMQNPSRWRRQLQLPVFLLRVICTPKSCYKED